MSSEKKLNIDSSSNSNEEGLLRNKMSLNILNSFAQLGYGSGYIYRTSLIDGIITTLAFGREFTIIFHISQ